MAGHKGKDLREACIQEALAIIETSGIEELSLREISRRLGVSHQAPYKHFPSRDYILAEIVSRAFESFARYLDDRPHTENAYASLEAMGRAYFSYALTHPLQYRLMFGTPLPDPQQHPQMMQNSKHAFSLLRDCIAELRKKSGHIVSDSDVELDALFVWSTIHGMATIIQSSTLDTLSLPEDVINKATQHALFRIGIALGVDLPQ